MTVFFNFFNSSKKAAPLSSTLANESVEKTLVKDKKIVYSDPLYNREQWELKILPNRNPDLKYREDGDVDYDPKSKNPGFVAYNNIREAIRQAKKRGDTHVKVMLSNATEEMMRKDGYMVVYRNSTEGDGMYDTVSW